MGPLDESLIATAIRKNTGERMMIPRSEQMISIKRFKMMLLFLISGSFKRIAGYPEISTTLYPTKAFDMSGKITMSMRDLEYFLRKLETYLCFSFSTPTIR